MRRGLGIATLLLTGLLFCGPPVHAWSHMAQVGETLEQLAARYYGDKSLAIVIRAANGFVHPDDGRLAEGERVEIPEVTYYRIDDGDTWRELASRFLSSPDRDRFLAEMNGLSPDQMPATGTIIKLPYHLRHIFAKGETLKSVTRLYYKNTRTVDWLRQYNSPEKTKYGRGEVIIVPLIHLELTKEESERIDAFRSRQQTHRDADEQVAAREAIAGLKKAYARGRYVQIVASASRLIGYGHLTVPQEIGVHNYLAYAYVALGEKSLAVAAFKRALTLQPDMELSTITNSPKILAVFNEAKQALVKQKKASPGPPAGGPDKK
jgi:tetratricopeptide (TPR) repeat protein